MKIKYYIGLGVLIFAIGCARNDLSGKVEFSGTLEMTEHLVGAKVTGRLNTVNIQEGDQVKVGQLIATLDRFDQAQKDLNRLESLYKHGGTTQQNIEYAQLAVEDQQIFAPVDGVVLVKVRETGEIVPAGSTVAVIGDRKDLWVRIFVPEGMINRVMMGQKAKLRFDGIKESFDGHVSFIASGAEFTPRNVQTAEERVTQAFAVKVVLDSPPDYLRPGVSADVVF